MQSPFFAPHWDKQGRALGIIGGRVRETDRPVKIGPTAVSSLHTEKTAF